MEQAAEEPCAGHLSVALQPEKGDGQEGHALAGHKDREARRPQEPGACRAQGVGKRKQREGLATGGFL